jgi:hypothetical protein
VAQDGAITWNMEGFPKHEERGADGQTISSCDDAIKLIDRIRHEAAERGVQLSEPTWKGKDPNPKRKNSTAKPIPVPAVQKLNRKAQSS